MDETTMSARELRDALGRRIDAAHFLDEVTLVTKSGEQRAALVPYTWYVQRRNWTESKEAQI